MSSNKIKYGFKIILENFTSWEAIVVVGSVEHFQLDKEFEDSCEYILLFNAYRENTYTTHS